MTDEISAQEAADGLREQAASCRRLARRAKTDAGSVALRAVADQFDTDARRLNVFSETRTISYPMGSERPTGRDHGENA